LIFRVIIPNSSEHRRSPIKSKNSIFAASCSNNLNFVHIISNSDI